MTDDTSPPEDADIARTLGSAFAAFDRLRALRPTVTAEWRRYSKKSPWTLKVVEGKRTLYYLTPTDGSLTVSIILGERATEAVLAADGITERVKTDLRQARPYLEGRGIRVPVASTADTELVARLVAIKLDPARGG
jgi:hypothetical protein